MQAHHIISADSMKHLQDGPFKHNIEYFNYDINHLENLVFLPSTLQGACHLGVQPHTGNHTVQTPVEASSKTPEGESDALISTSYHEKVASRIRGVKPLTMHHCIAEYSDAQDQDFVSEVKKGMDAVSSEVLILIQNKPNKAPLTRLFEYFQPNNPIGCAGVDRVGGHDEGSGNKMVNLHANHQCSVDRNHRNAQGSGQRPEGITYLSAGKYQLKIGS